MTCCPTVSEIKCLYLFHKSTLESGVKSWMSETVGDSILLHPGRHWKLHSVVRKNSDRNSGVSRIKKRGRRSNLAPSHLHTADQSQRPIKIRKVCVGWWWGGVPKLFDHLTSTSEEAYWQPYCTLRVPHRDSQVNYVYLKLAGTMTIASLRYS